MSGMFRVVAFVISLIMLLSLAACGGTENEEGSAQSMESLISESIESTEEETTEPIVPVSLELVVDKKCDFTVVYDTTDTVIKKPVEKFLAAFNEKLSEPLKTQDIRFSRKIEKRIVIGKGIDVGDEFTSKLKNYNDFGIKVSENTLILSATNDVAYNYLFDYFLDSYFKDTTTVTLTHENNIVYSSSELFGKQYTDYHRELAGTCEPEFMLKLYEDRRLDAGYGINMPYRLYVPFDYTPEKEYPVLFYLHSAGQPGSDNERPIQVVICNLFNHKVPYVDDAIVIVPQCPSGAQWVNQPFGKGAYSIDKIAESDAMKTALKIFELVRENFSTDESRYYTLGLSMGGYGVWDVITRHPELWAAAVPLCGGGDPSNADKIVDINIWTFHSVDDEGVPVSGTRNTVNAIKKAGGTKVEYTEYNIGLGHGIGTYTTQKDELSEWMFAQRKSN